MAALFNLPIIQRAAFLGRSPLPLHAVDSPAKSSTGRRQVGVGRYLGQTVWGEAER
jgi:hypothetical protein